MRLRRDLPRRAARPADLLLELQPLRIEFAGKPDLLHEGRWHRAAAADPGGWRSHERGRYRRGGDSGSTRLFGPDAMHRQRSLRADRHAIRRGAMTSELLPLA